MAGQPYLPPNDPNDLAIPTTYPTRYPERMPSAELQRLWKLAQIDRQIVEIRHQAAALQVGQRAQAELEQLQAEEGEVGGRARAIKQEITDLELAQKGGDEKRKKIQKEIYGGKVVNPREVANLEKEIESIKHKQDRETERLLELYDLLPPAAKAAEEVQARLKVQQEVMVKKRQEAMETKKKLEEAFHRLTAQRPDALKGISPTLLARYENIRKNHGGIGMVEVEKRTLNCGGCGMHQPERTITILKEDKVAVCEACHRILYYTEGAV